MTTGSEQLQGRYDCIVIGSGQGGKPLATAFAKAGRKTALIEKAHVGGTCINVGCTPTKTMVASARVAYLASRAADFGVHAGEVRVSMAEVRRRKQGVVESFRSGSQKHLEATPGLDLIFGEAAFEGSLAIKVLLRSGETSRLTAGQIFINAGCRPAPARVDGIESIAALDSSSIMELDTLPSHLLVLGGGYIGLEFAQIFRRFGSAVTVVELGPRLLAQEDPDVSGEVASVLGQDGIEILLETRAVHAAKAGDASIRLTVRGPGGDRELTGSHLLAAAGRVPNTEGLGLEAAGVRTDAKGFIHVNERLETSAPGVFAMGDINGGPAFTHISYDDFRILRTNLLESGDAKTSGRLVPYTVFIDPQLGRIGLNETQARAQGRRIKIARLPMSSVARAIEMGETRGFMKAVVDADTLEVLGYTVLGIEGGELMAIMEVAMMGRLPCTALREAIFAHPTLAESLNNLFGALSP